ncbi:hypothetical protein [Nocardiopsis sp. Huas11]|uniref:hypothetical protein n=1 Tax=Nocardiopsis sp. Huas11 TaxID=2183912 RepID=UPI0018F423D8|nr:hypothetical protein [Nocardiopsis sp. Huas11]
MNADHLAAYRLDPHGNPVGNPERFSFDLTGAAAHRDAQVRHALTRLLHWTQRTGAAAIAIEDLDFTAEKTREKHGRRKRFRQLIIRYAHRQAPGPDRVDGRRTRNRDRGRRSGLYLDVGRPALGRASDQQ